MKKTGIFIVVLLSVISQNKAYCQTNHAVYLDSIFINIEDKIEITIATHNYAEIKDLIVRDIKSFQGILGQDSSFVLNYQAFSINYMPDKSLTIKRAEPIQKIILHEGKQTSFIFKGECHITGEKYTMQLQFCDPEDIFSDLIIEKINRVFSDMPEKNRIAFSYNYSFKDNKLLHDGRYDQHNGNLDLLEIKIEAGANLLKEQPVVDFTTALGFQFEKHGIMKHHFYVAPSFMFISDENNNFHENTIVSLGYQNNLSNNRDKYKWLGFEIGYLTNKDGDFFSGNTFRFGFTWSLANSISVASHFYLEDGDKFYPALRVGFSF
jgi:hypothetical protein